MMNGFADSIVEMIHRSGLLLLQMLPFVLAGALLGAVFQRYRFTSFFQKIKRLPLVPLVIVSALLGAVSPFCTFGTVPVVIGLLSNGFPLSAGIAFLTTSSIVNPQMLMIQVATLGPFLSVLQGLAGIGIGVMAGLVVRICEKRGVSVINQGLQLTGEESCHRKQRSLWTLFIRQLEFVLIYMVIGVLLSSTIEMFLPNNAMAISIKTPVVLSVIIGAAASVPLYVCGGSSMPVLGMLLERGMPAGAVLAFIIAGPATRVQALTAVKSLIDKRALFGYISLVLVGAALAGLAVNSLVSGGSNFYGLQ